VMPRTNCRRHLHGRGLEVFLEKWRKLCFKTKLRLARGAGTAPHLRDEGEGGGKSGKRKSVRTDAGNGEISTTRSGSWTQKIGVLE